MDDKDVAELLITRYLDDWAYQTTVRPEVTGVCYGMGVNPYKLDDVITQMDALTTEKMNAFAAENLIVPNRWQLKNLNVTLPWLRVFECNSRFTLE